jgi:hypothetical protein
MAFHISRRHPIHAGGEIDLAYLTCCASSHLTCLSKSPRWLAIHGHIEKAERALAVCRGLPASQANNDYIIKREVEEIRNSVEYEKNIQGGWIDCFSPKRKMLYRTLLGMSLQALQQLTGANYFFYYGATIFQPVGVQDSFVTQIILGAVNFGCTVSSLFAFSYSLISVLTYTCQFLGLYVMERVPGFSKFILLIANISLCSLDVGCR